MLVAYIQIIFVISAATGIRADVVVINSMKPGLAPRLKVAGAGKSVSS